MSAQLGKGKRNIPEEEAKQRQASPKGRTAKDTIAKGEVTSSTRAKGTTSTRDTATRTIQANTSRARAPYGKTFRFIVLMAQ
jgi:hypothetical protein